jgi:signal peptidase II
VADIARTQPIRVTPFFELILVWNRGISYGLFQQHSELGRWLLIVFSLIAAVGLSIWAWRSGERLLALALGLIAGGALGNVVDRLLYGAVLDFAHLFWGGFSWYVFNIADAAIVAGVALLLYDSVRSRGGDAPKPS